MKLPSSNQIRVHLSFDTFFVPKRLGINEDIRELVLPAPALVQLGPASP